jgi:hypothetical protein
MTITPHSLVMFQLQHGQQVKNTLSINKPHIGLSKYIFQKLNKPNKLKNWKITRKMWANNLLSYLSFKPKAKSTSLVDVRSGNLSR